MNDLFEKEIVHEGLLREILAEVKALREEVANLKAKPKPRKPSVDPVAYSDDFEQFWAAYPRKVSKVKAWCAYRRLVKSDRIKVLNVIGEWAKSWKDTEAQFIPHPATWLNSHRFNDELRAAVPEQKPKMPITEDDWNALAAFHGLTARSGESWPEFKQRISEAAR
jgi:hypothetical protein